MKSVTDHLIQPVYPNSDTYFHFPNVKPSAELRATDPLTLVALNLTLPVVALKLALIPNHQILSVINSAYWQAPAKVEQLLCYSLLHPA